MALQSQSQRSGARGGGSMSKRARQKRRRRAIGILSVVLIIAACIYYVGPFGGENNVNANTDKVAANGNPVNTGNQTQNPVNNTTTGVENGNQNINSNTVPDKNTNVNNTNVEENAPPVVNTNKVENTPNKITTPSGVAGLVAKGKSQIADGQLLLARLTLNQALQTPGLSEAEAIEIRKPLSAVNDELIFSAKVEENDPFTEYYVVKGGDNLSKIASQYNVPWKFLARINGTKDQPLDPRRIRIGMRLKVVKGPFHAKVSKNHYRLDIYLKDVYVRSFNVGLGKHDSTPLGKFVVRKHSKLENPKWTNPRTGEEFEPDNPKNPLGEFWIGLKGIDKDTELLQAYGIHGTIEPDSIGTQASMGCVRMRHEDVEWVYYMLNEEVSVVTIIP